MTAPSASSYAPATLAVQQIPYVAATSVPIVATATYGTGVAFTSPTGGTATGAGTGGSPWLLGPFVPVLTRPIHLTLNATGASGSVQLLRSTDGGATKLPITRDGAQIGLYEFGGLTGIVVNEPVRVETDEAATYYLQVILTAGALTLRAAQ